MVTRSDSLPSSALREALRQQGYVASDDGAGAAAEVLSAT